MKVKISKYGRFYIADKIILNRWLAYHHEKSYWNVKESEYTWSDKAVEKFCDFLQPIMNLTINKITNREQKIDVRIDNFDVWSLDNTLAYIIAPALEKLKETKHGVPFVDDGDLPEHLRGKNDGNEGYSEDRWNYVLDEMIFAFNSINDPDAEDQFYKNRDQLKMNFEKSDDLPEGFSEVKFEYGEGYHYDREGHKAFHQRQQKGFELFGKYFRSLWD